jgi:hypothetical protein
VVTITYADAPYDVKAYYQALVQSDWLTVVGADYGVGHGQVTGSLVFDGGAPASVSDQDVTVMIGELIADGGIPAPTANSIYVVYYPEGTTITSNGGTSCYSFGGYHSFFSADGGYVVYAVIPSCGSAAGSLITAEDTVDEAFSHEFIEAATDPVQLPTKAGYVLSDYTDPWTFAFGEIGDLCTYTTLYVAPDGGLTAQRIWSNSAALLGTGSPCVPAPAGDAYFNVSVDPGSTVIVDGGASQNQTISFTLTGWSTAPVADWSVWAVPSPIGSINPSFLNPLIAGSNYPHAINNGQTLTLTVNIPAGTQGGNFAGIVLYSYVSPNQIDFFGSYSAAAVYVQ